mmetsp:Transcript_9767/g.27693  ORF Transcript_9767/g.27693 Transcript_9767/m.27693 type:complete len:436 (-) Transcript_9767:422-1729(-)
MNFDKEDSGTRTYFGSASCAQRHDQVIQQPFHMIQRQHQQTLLQFGMLDGFEDPQHIHGRFHSQQHGIRHPVLARVAFSEVRDFLQFLIRSFQSFQYAITSCDAHHAALHGSFTLRLGVLACVIIVTVVFCRAAAAGLQDASSAFGLASVHLVEHLFQFSLPFFLQEDNVLGAFPNSHLTIHAAAENEGTGAADGETVHFRHVAAQDQDLLKAVTIPVSDRPILARRKEVVRSIDELDVRDAVFVSVKGPMGVSKVESPNLDRFVGSAGHKDRIIIAGVNRQCGQFVTIQTEEELEGIIKEDLDGGVQAGNDHHAFGWIGGMRVLDRDHVVIHLQHSGLDQHGRVIFLVGFDIPKFDGLVSRARDDCGRVLSRGRPAHIDAPDGTIMGFLLRKDDFAGGNINEQQMAFSGSDHDVRIAGQELDAKLVTWVSINLG